MFRLLRYYAIASAVPVIAMTVGLLHFYYQDQITKLVDITEEQNNTLTQAVANSIWPQFSDYVMTVQVTDGNALRSRTETMAMHAAIRRLVANLPLLKIKIYNLDGVTIYSSEPGQIGQNKSDRPAFVAAASTGQVGSKRSYRETFFSFDGPVVERHVIESYVPIYNLDREIEAVFEIYSDVTPLVSRIQSQITELVFAVSSVFMLLYFTLFLIVRRANKIVEAQYRQIKGAEQEFQAFANASSDWFWKMDENLRFSYFSDNFVKVTGVPVEALLGKTRQETGIPNVDEAAWHQHLADLAAHRPFRDFRHPRGHPDGRTVHLSINGQPVFDDRDTFKGYLGTGSDVTERVRYDRAFRDSQTDLAKAQALAKTGNWRWSIEDESLISCSEEYARIHGVGLDKIHDLMAVQMERVVHPADRDRVAEAFQRFDKNTARYEIEYRIVRPDGEVRHVLEIGETIVDDSGKAVEQAGTIQDITERKLAEQALRKAHDELELRVEERTAELKQREQALVMAKNQAEIANRGKSEFLANMSHELRTPLNAVIGFAELIKDEQLGPIEHPQYREYVGDIYESGIHLLNLINDILDLSKIEAGNARINEEEVDVRDIVQSCTRLIQPRAATGELNLSADLPSGQLPVLIADPRMLKQILINLLSNAVKFTPPGGRIEIKVNAEATEGYRLQVSDTGIGIAPEDIPKALARFEQIDGQLTRKFQGSGLGLPLAKSLVELHGGELKLRSQPGAGTTVEIRFPVERMALRLGATPLPVKVAVG